MVPWQSTTEFAPQTLTLTSLSSHDLPTLLVYPAWSTITSCLYWFNSNLLCFPILEYMSFFWSVSHIVHLSQFAPLQPYCTHPVLLHHTIKCTKTGTQGLRMVIRNPITFFNHVLKDLLAIITTNKDNLNRISAIRKIKAWCSLSDAWGKLKTHNVQYWEDPIKFSPSRGGTYCQW